MCPTKYYQIMRLCIDKRQHRYQMVQYALQEGKKPAARTYNTDVKVVRKWVRRFLDEGYQGLQDRSRRPKRMPGKIPEKEREHIAALKDIYKRLGAEQVKQLEGLSTSPKTIRKIWREAGKSTRRRRPKYQTKRNLREVKKQYRLFERVCEDTKDLIDIPEYWSAMMRYNLPRVQYTFREVSCGIQFLGFANERSLTHATCFARYINFFLESYRVLPPESIRQTDNGSEYCGSWNALSASSYTKEIERLGGQRHRTIFPGAYTQQADVETVHNLIEQEFYEIETFKNRMDFLKKAYTYQLFFNMKRPNMYKEGKTPLELSKEKIPNLDETLLMIPPVDLDEMLEYQYFFNTGGDDLLTVP